MPLGLVSTATGSGLPQARRRRGRRADATDPHRRGPLRAAREIRAELPEVSVLVLSQYVEVAYARELLAESYLLKDRVADVELVVSDRAVEKHVTGIFSKLDLGASSEDHRRVLAVLHFLDQPG